MYFSQRFIFYLKIFTQKIDKLKALYLYFCLSFVYFKSFFDERQLIRKYKEFYLYFILSYVFFFHPRQKIPDIYIYFFHIIQLLVHISKIKNVYNGLCCTVFHINLIFHLKGHILLCSFWVHLFTILTWRSFIKSLLNATVTASIHRKIS